MADALTDAKGNRSPKPSQQPDPDTNLRVVEVRDDGIVIRGAKLVVRATTPLEEYANYARKIINIEEEIAEPQKK